MSEGKLQTRLRKAEIRIGSYYTDTGIHLKEALKIVDDARRDFPRDSGFGFNEDGTPIYDVYDWFKKWFGEEKK